MADFEPIDLGAELADFTDAERAPLSRMPSGYVDMVQGVTITGPPVFDGFGPPGLPPDGGRCAQCRRHIPLSTIAAIHAYERGELLCDECAWMRRRT